MSQNLFWLTIQEHFLTLLLVPGTHNLQAFFIQPFTVIVEFISQRILQQNVFLHRHINSVLWNFPCTVPVVVYCVFYA